MFVRTLLPRLGVSVVLLATLSSAPVRADDTKAPEKTNEMRKQLDSLLDRWNDSVTGDRLAQAVALCTSYLDRAKGEDKPGELDFALELTRLHMAQNNYEAALKDVNGARLTAAEIKSERLNEAKALNLLAFIRASQERLAKLLPPNDANITPEQRAKAQDDAKKANEEFQKAAGEQMQALTDAVGSKDAARKLLSEQNERVATAATVNELGKAPKAIEKLDTAGVTIRLSAYPGKVVMVDFWATWCGPCMGELPNVLKVYADYHDRGLEIVGISLDQDRAKLDAKVKEMNIPWRQYFDGKGWENDVSRAWGVVAIPRTYLIDHTGKVRFVNARGEGLAAAVKVLIERAEKAAGKDGATTPVTPPAEPKKGD